MIQSFSRPSLWYSLCSFLFFFQLGDPHFNYMHRNIRVSEEFRTDIREKVKGQPHTHSSNIKATIALPATNAPNQKATRCGQSKAEKPCPSRLTSPNKQKTTKGLKTKQTNSIRNQHKLLPILHAFLPLPSS